jgi:isopentenyl-diphosphate delta-isomerase
VSDPLIQVVDSNDNLVGVASVQEAQDKGLIQRISRVMTEDENGNVLLQKRAGHKRLFPDRWDNSVAGHVDEGEDYIQAAHREMKEEIGIRVDALEEVDYFYTSFTFKEMKLNQFQKLYKAIVPADTVFKIGQDEVSMVKWFERPELKGLLDKPENLTVGLAEAIKRLYS